MERTNDATLKQRKIGHTVRISTAPVDRVATGRPKSGSDSATNPVKLAAVGVRAIAQSLGHAFEEGTTVAGIERRGGPLEVFSKNLIFTT